MHGDGAVTCTFETYDSFTPTLNKLCSSNVNMINHQQKHEVTDLPCHREHRPGFQSIYKCVCVHRTRFVFQSSSNPNH